MAGLGDPLGTAVYFLTMGLALLLSGVATLVYYLGHTRPPEENP
jgi:uncharacterized membrane protein HdeD (DUF308 family)